MRLLTSIFSAHRMPARRFAGTQRGFLLVTAVTLIVVVALILSVMVFLSATSEESGASHMQSGQALFVAESGLERAMVAYQTGTACNSLTFVNVSFGAGQFSATGRMYNPATPAVLAAGGVNNSVTTIPTTSASLAADGYAPSGRIHIDSEEIFYTGLAGGSFTGAQRGVAGTTAAAHAAGTAVYQNLCRLQSIGMVGGARRIVERSAQSPGAMMVYAKLNGDGNVYFRRWDGASWGAESTVFTATPDIQFLVLRFSRIRNEGILGVQTSNGDIRVRMWNGSSWIAPPGMPTPLANVTAGANARRRGFDIRYERSSDHAIIVYNTNVANQITFRTWDGSIWSGASTTTLSSVGIPRWIEMASSPLSTSDDVALLVLGDNSGNPSIYGKLWNGAAWTQLEAGAPTIWDTTVASFNYKAMDVAYEEQSGRAMFIWGDDAANSIRFRIWNGATLTAGATIPGLTAMSNVASWIRLVPDPFSNQLMFGVMDQGRDLNTALWSGAAWTVHAEHDTSTEAGNDRNFDFVFETYPSNAGQGWLVWGGRPPGSGGTRWTYRKQWSGGWSPFAAMSDRSALVQLTAHPATGAVFAALYQDRASGPDDIKEQHLTGGGAAWSVEATIWPGQTVNNPVLERVYVAPERNSQAADWREVFQ